jgi:hypothetical protein
VRLYLCTSVGEYSKVARPPIFPGDGPHDASCQHIFLGLKMEIVLGIFIRRVQSFLLWLVGTQATTRESNGRIRG